MEKRLLFYEIVPYFSHKNAIIVNGMRQVGKTTLLRQIYDEIQLPKLWFDFDNPLEQLYFENLDYRAIYSRLIELSGNSELRLHVFIDEIQNYPPVTKVIKYLIDHYNVKFFVTGSAQFYLKNLFPESLSGRKLLFDLKPMSFREILYFKHLVSRDEISFDIKRISKLKNDITIVKPLENLYEIYLEFGGFPEVVMTKDTESRKLVLKNIFTSFFEKDLRILADLKDIRDVRDMILLLVPRVGNLLDVTRLASELGINRVKAYQILEFLQNTFILNLLPRYTKSIDKRIAGGKKVYFADNGLLNYIGKVSQGQLFENALFLQLSNYGDLTFFNEKNKAEIDFILNGNLAFEAKNKGIPSDFERLSKLAKSNGFVQKAVISNIYTDSDGIFSPCIF
jgi:predicted AAA+ superfamily ATPase